MWSQKTNEMMKRIGKIVAKNDPRSYATVMEVTPGQVVYTDGYGLLRYKNSEITAEGTVYLDHNLARKTVGQYPYYEKAIDTHAGRSLGVDQEKFFKIISSLSTKPVKGVFINLEGYPKLTTEVGEKCYNPWLIKKFLAGTKIEPQSVVVYDETMKITYGDAVDVTLVAIRSQN